MPKRIHSIPALLLFAAVFPSLALGQDVPAPINAAGTAEAAEAAAAATWVDSYDALLQKYVKPTGVNYKAWHSSTADRAALRAVTTEISRQSVSGMSRDARLAFYLNAYNAWILHRILQDYPTDGPGGGGFFGRNAFFRSNAIRVAGSRTSFHDLENDIIRLKFRDSRIHFAVNCASRSCPPLHNRAFRAGTLSATLDALTRAFVNENGSGVAISEGGNKVEVSEIFDWYREDFKGGAILFINRYRTSRIPAKAKLSFQDYSWKLNQSR